MERTVKSISPFLPSLFFLFAATNVTITYAEKKSEEISKTILKEKSEYSPEFIEHATKAAVDNLNTADQILEDLAQKVNNNIFPRANKIMTRAVIMQTRSIIKTLRTRSTVDVGIESLSLIVVCNDLLIEQIRVMIVSGMKTVPEFDIKQLSSRSVLSQEAIALKLVTHEKILKNMDETTEKAGLNWFNKGYRKVENVWTKHKGWSRLTELTLALIIAGIIVHNIPNEYFGKLDSKPLAIDVLSKNKVVGKIIENAAVSSGISAPTTLIDTVPADKQIIKASQSGLFNSKIMQVKKGISKVLMKFKDLVGTYEEDPSRNPYEGANSDGTPRTIFAMKRTGLGKKIASGIRAFSPLYVASYGAYKISPSHIKKDIEGDISNLRDWFSEKFNRANNFLRGGKPRQLVSLEKKPEITLDDIIGMEHAKQELAPILDYLRNPEKFDQAGTQPEKGILLFGPSRTGKSYFAEALSGTITKMFDAKGQKDAFKFLSLNAATIMDYDNALKEIGIGGIEYIMATARRNAPCVIFVDELDLLGLQREGDRKALSQFLTCMSGALTRETDKQVIIIGATNKPEHLDFALKQPGRFGKLIYFDYPKFDARFEFFNRELSKRCIAPSDFNLEKLARETEGCSFENLNDIVKASLQRARVNQKIVTQSDFETCLDTNVRHILPTAKELPKYELETIAAYLSGQALSTLIFDTPEKLVKITTQPVSKKISEGLVGMDKYKAAYSRGQNNDESDPYVQEAKAIEYGKCFVNYVTDTLKIVSEKQAIAQIKMLLAGFASEKILLGGTTYSYKTENKKEALERAEKLVFAGLDAQYIAKNIRNEKLQEAYQLVKKCEDEVLQELTAHKDLLEKIFKELLDKKTLTADQIKKLFYTGDNEQKVMKETAEKSTLTEEQKETLIKLTRALMGDQKNQIKAKPAVV